MKSDMIYRRPLVHCVTSPVTMKSVADAIVAVGGRPLMSMEPSEFAEVYQAAKACYLNLGMTTAARFTVMQSAQREALLQNVPIVFDAVGAALSEVRRKRARSLLTAGVTVLHGNISELSTLLSLPTTAQGVDAGTSRYDAAEIARQAYEEFGCMAVVSGATDAVAGPDGVTTIDGGTPLLGDAVGMGCVLSALFAVAVTQDAPQQQLIAMCRRLKRAGESAAQKKVGFGYFSAEVISILAQPEEGKDG